MENQREEAESSLRPTSYRSEQRTLPRRVHIEPTRAARVIQRELLLANAMRQFVVDAESNDLNLIIGVHRPFTA